MKPIRLAVIFDQHIRAGGGYQQALNAALQTCEFSADICTPIFFTTHKSNLATLASLGIQAEFIQLSFSLKTQTYFNRFLSLALGSKLSKFFDLRSPFENFLLQRNIDLVYFLSPSSLALHLYDINFLITVWDLSHRDTPEFPEVRSNREFQKRELLYSTILPRSTAIFVDSELGKKNIVQRYGIDAYRVHALPFQPAVATRHILSSNNPKPIDIHAKYNLNSYVFYPAQFWPHKNHVYLLEGLLALEQLHGVRIGAIFSGGDQGNLAYVKDYVCKIGLQDRVRFLGFVKNEEIPELYRQSLALVMPSYFGPTNLPPLEAFSLGVPVLYSDNAGMRDQVGDAALLMDLHNPASMANHLKNLIDHPTLCARLIESGKKRLHDIDSVDRLGILIKVIQEFRWKRLTWR